MPGPAWSIPARHCKRGAILAKTENSTCSNCYALKNRYRFPNVQRTLQARLDHYNQDPQSWIHIMIAAITTTDCTHFRWFDSGDLQSVDMLLHIIAVCINTPEVKHWLPTRERTILRQGMQLAPIPPNLTIRLSATYIDQQPPTITPENEPFIKTSTVVTKGATCPASAQGNQCLTCRKCWDRNVSNVSYPLH